MLTAIEMNFEGLEIQKWKENGAFFVLFADDSKTSVTVYAKRLQSAPKRTFWVLSKNWVVDRFWSYRLWDIEGKSIKKLESQQKIMKLSSRVELNKIFQMHVNILSKLWLIFCWHQRKTQKMSHYWHLNDHNLDSKHDN